MKFAFSTNAFRKFSFSQAAEAIAGAGYAGIEIMCDVPHAYPAHLSREDIQAIRQDLDDHCLAVSNLNAFMMNAIQDFHHPSWIEKDPDFRRIRIQHTLDCIDLAAALGAKTISTEPGGPLCGMEKETAADLFADGLHQVLPRAREKGITVLIEPEPDLLIQTSDEYLGFVHRCSHPNLGLNLDVGHFYCVGEDPVTVIEKLQAHTCHYHLEDIPETREHRHILPGEGGIDMKGVLQAIARTGFKGFITVELYPYLDNPEKAAADAISYIRKIHGHD
jgi:sugar phosphate isomerase/epimerase